MSEELDRARITALAEALLGPIRDNYRRGPVHRNRVFESLNALAVVVAATVAVADDGGLQEFFDRALDQQVADARALRAQRWRA